MLNAGESGGGTAEALLTQWLLVTALALLGA
jgi:hypothetical protein